LHRAIRDGKLDHPDLPATAKRDFAISAVEYVDGFFGGEKVADNPCLFNRRR
jgi:hypothetical protein